jgi:hypothetical protein
MTMLSESFPPLRYKTTRFRDELPCALAICDRKEGAAKPIVKAATPSRMNTRRVNFMTSPSFSFRVDFQILTLQLNSHPFSVVFSFYDQRFSWSLERSPRTFAANLFQ